MARSSAVFAISSFASLEDDGVAAAAAAPKLAKPSIFVAWVDCSSATRTLPAKTGSERMRCQSASLSSKQRFSRWAWGTMLMYAAFHAAMWMVAMA